LEEVNMATFVPGTILRTADDFLARAADLEQEAVRMAVIGDSYAVEFFTERAQSCLQQALELAE
jgi:hypothetical protein